MNTARSDRNTQRTWLNRWSLTAMALAGCVIVFGLHVAQVATQPVVSCTEQGSPSKPPAALVTAEDYIAQGDYDYDRGDCDQAIADYTRAIALNPNFAEAYNNRAYTFMVKKNYASALPDLDRAIQLRPTYVNALLNRGDIYNYYYQVDRARAIADYSLVLALGADAYRHTSLCGHLAMARHQGNLPIVLIEFLTSRSADCIS